VGIEPTFVVRVDRTDQKELISVGELVSVDTNGGTFVADLRQGSGSARSRVTFVCATSTISGTVFQVDGIPSRGSTGLTALAALGAGASLQTFGDINTTTSTINCAYCEAGIGTYFGGSDWVEGVIYQRSGGLGADATLNVIGHGANAAGTTLLLNTQFTINTSFANTKVVRRASATALDMDDLNVGQRVRVYGALNTTTATMDASTATSVIRQKPVFVFGYANAAPSGGVMTMTLNRVGPYLVAGVIGVYPAFNFTVNTALQADTANFNVNAGSLTAGLGITTGTAVNAHGFFPTIDAAGADFDASTVTNIDLAPSLMRIRYLPATTSAILTTSASEIRFNIGVIGAGGAAVVDRGLAGSTSLTQTPNPGITAAGGFTLFLIVENGQIAIYTAFADFSTALFTRAGTAGSELFAIGAWGTYTPATQTLQASLVVAILY
jgi:hypothetical protein